MKRRPHYAWVVLAAAIAVSTISAGTRFSFAIIIDPLVERFGWSRGGISFAYSLAFLSSVPVTLGAGWLSDRLGPRRLILACALVFSLAMVLTGTLTQLWQLYLYYGFLLGGVAMGVLTITIPVMVSRWFHKRLGLAMGLLWTSVGLGPMFMAPLLRWAIAEWEWQMAFSVFGLAGGGVITLASLFLRGRPEDVGMEAYGGREGEERAPNPSGSAALPLGMVTATSAFWALILIHFAGCVGHSFPIAHMVSMATFSGVPSLAAAGVVSFASGASIVSRFGMSLLAANWGGKRTLALAFLLQSSTIPILLGAREVWGFYLFAIFFGLGYGGEMVAFPIVNRQYYGSGAPLNTIYGIQIAGASLGMALGGWMGGVLFDLTGNYVTAIVVAAAFSFSGLIPVLFLPPYKPGRVIVPSRG